MHSFKKIGELIADFSTKIGDISKKERENYEKAPEAFGDDDDVVSVRESLFCLFLNHKYSY